MQQTTAPQSFQKSLTNEVWATFPPTQITLTVFLCTDVSFSTAFLLYCARFVFRVKHPESYISGQLFAIHLGCGRGGGAVDTHTQTFITCDSKLGHIKRPKYRFFSNLAQTQQELPPIPTPWRFSERAICLGVVTATISGPSCTSLLSCKWSRDPDQWSAGR